MSASLILTTDSKPSKQIVSTPDLGAKCSSMSIVPVHLVIRQDKPRQTIAAWPLDSYVGGECDSV